jgi:phosphoribosylformimino-5-aminoimidazole carboxamide ribotide isomerase
LAVLIPCIDLQGGQAVQLVHGRKRELAVRDVFGLLDKFQGYEWLHLIDLDAAMGKPRNDMLLRDLSVQAHERYGMRVRIGGGIRNLRRATSAAKWGAEQIIVGSAAFRDGQVNALFLGELANRIGPKRVVVALDTAKGRIVTHGWRRDSTMRAADVMPYLEKFCSAFLCTDVDREGTMRGANLRWFRELRSATSYPIIAAGGIKTQREIAALQKLGMDAAVGMALYKNRLK